MELILGALADSANVSQEGKLNILGIFDNLFAQALPCQHPQMTLVLMLRASGWERGTSRKIIIRFLDEDGGALFPPAEFGIDIAQNTPTPAPMMPLIVNLPNVVFPRYGTYRFDVLDGEAMLAQIPLQVSPPPSFPPTA